MKWILKRYMIDQHIESFNQLADMTGIARRTLFDRINAPRTLRVYEVAALDKVLHFSEDDLLRLARGDIE